MNQPHGLAFQGSTLYVAESDQIDAFDYADGKVTRPRTVAGGLPDAQDPELGGAYAHALKSVAVGPDGAVYFSIGSTGNVSAADRTATPQRATIMRVPPGGGPYAPFATGVRNGTGLAVAPDGSVWTAVNNRDNVEVPDQGSSYGQVVPDYVDDHPPESIAKLTAGRELGWPYCNPDGGPANLPLIRDVQTNADGSKLDCAALPPIEQSLGAHAAPLGMSFVDGSLPAPYDHGALVGVHGSWNRQPPRAPEVSFFPSRDGGLGDQKTLVGGFQTADGSRWGRPVGARRSRRGGVRHRRRRRRHLPGRTAWTLRANAALQRVEHRRHLLLRVIGQLLEDDLHCRVQQFGRPLHLQIGVVGDHRTCACSVDGDGVGRRR